MLHHLVEGLGQFGHDGNVEGKGPVSRAFECTSLCFVEPGGIRVLSVPVSFFWVLFLRGSTCRGQEEVRRTTSQK